ncbi:MAG: DeoR/GlpR transcriptional regulator [Clostridia bacterium]|nr:DeoR/GlpR transcriptional regulator [Clostridia bacterium]
MNSRQTEIIDFLKSGSKSIKEISGTLFIGEMTVRRELKLLEDEGIVTKYRGIVTLSPENTDVSYELRRDVLQAEKAELAKKAMSFLDKDQLIFVDGSTTCRHLVPEIAKYRNSVVVTNSLMMALDLSRSGVNVKIAPGKIDDFEKSVIGCDAVRYIENFNFDVAFFSGKGFDDEKITDSNEEQIHIRKTVMERSKKSVFMMDSSKKNKLYPFTVANLEDIILIKTEDGENA